MKKGKGNRKHQKKKPFHLKKKKNYEGENLNRNLEKKKKENPHRGIFWTPSAEILSKLRLKKNKEGEMITCLCTQFRITNGEEEIGACGRD